MRAWSCVFGLGLLTLACGPQNPDPTATEATTPTSSMSTTDATSSSSSETTVGPGTSSSSTATVTVTSITTTATTATTETTSECVSTPEDWCDVFTQDCCEGFKCTSYDSDGDGSWDRTGCFSVASDGQHGEPCTLADEPGIDTCDVGHMCWDIQDGQGTCHAHCSGSAEDPMCEPEKTKCVISSSIALCLPTCDPLGDDCPEEDVCISDPQGAGFLCVLDASMGMGAEGSPCEFANVCESGSFCANPDFYPAPMCAMSLGCCAPFCDLNDPNACEGLSVPNAVCVPWFEEGEAPNGLEHVGGCGIQP